MDLEERSRQFVAAVARGDPVAAAGMGSSTAHANWNGSERQFKQACEHLAMVKGPWSVESAVTKRNVVMLGWQANVVRGILSFSWDRDGKVAFLHVHIKT